MNIVRIESLTYGVDDIDVSKRYYADWGLTLAEEGRHGADYVLPSGQTLRVRSVDDKGLPPAVEPGSTIREIVWGVDGKDALHAVGSALAADGAVDTSKGELRTRDPWGMSVAFEVAHPKAFSASPAVRDVNEPFTMTSRVQPLRIGHVVLNIPEAKVQAITDFYLDRLQFRLTDRVPQFGDFMRCAGSSDHHNLFLLQKPEGSLNHVAFEVSRIDEIIVGGTFMRDAGWQQATSLGRHVMGSNLFWYFQNPSGGLAEYFSDMDVLDDGWKPRVWDKNPGFSLWMT